MIRLVSIKNANEIEVIVEYLKWLSHMIPYLNELNLKDSLQKNRFRRVLNMSDHPGLYIVPWF